MTAVARYAYLHGRVSALAERLVPPWEMDQLAEQTGEQLAASFQTAGLSEFKPADLPGPQVLEQALMSVLVREAIVLIRPLTGAPRDLLTHWMRRFELINLKTIIRAKVTGDAAETTRAELADLGPLSALPVEELIHTEDVAELLRRLERTAYADMARQARALYEDQHDIFTMEAALDRQFYAGLAKRANGLSSDDQIYLRPLVGGLIDQINLVWLVRYRFTFGLSPPHAYYLLVPAGHHLNSRQLLELVQQESFSQVVQALPEPLKDLLAEATTISGMDAILDRETARAAWFVLRQTTFNVGRALAYLLLREKQLLRFHVAVRGQQLQLEPEVIRAAVGVTATAPSPARPEEA